jgi:hypothetical protein
MQATLHKTPTTTDTVAPGDMKKTLRAVIFGHLAGLVLAPTVKALDDRGILQLLSESPSWVRFDQIVTYSRGNPGYLQVAMRLLVACGWLRQRYEANGTRSFAPTSLGRKVLETALPAWREAASFIPRALMLKDWQLENSAPIWLASLPGMVRKARDGWGVSIQPEALQDQIRNQLDGVVAGPVMVALSRSGILSMLESGPIDIWKFKGEAAILGGMFDVLANQGWVTLEGDRVQLTPAGQYAAQIAASYGVTVSYLPLMNSVSTLLFGNARIRRVDDDGIEVFVDRGMNVWGSGGAHKTYFCKVDEVVADIFNRPLEQQPLGICDMGCGDGTFLVHLYSLIKESTARGKVLDTHPLVVIGADFNRVARRISKQTLRKAGIPLNHVVFGDINRPAFLAREFEKLTYDIHDFFHVRSFLDHNRPYRAPANYRAGSRPAHSTGAFAQLGDEIPADELEENLTRHLKRWAPYVGKFGLLVLELHTLPPELTAANLESTPAIAYDGTHGYSDQYLVELPVFLDCAREAGLRPDPRFQARFPDSELATVSINLLVTSH